MKKTIFLLNIDNYLPEVTKITYPLIERYAKKIDAKIHIIKSRKFPDWSVDYEKMQIYELGQGSDWVIYFDSDAVIHPDLPDFTELFDRNMVVNNGSDFANYRWKYDEYFRRDGRHIGCCSWLVVASSWTLDVFKPIDDLTPKEVDNNIWLTNSEKMFGMKPSHLQADYAMSRNVAKYGLKYATFIEYSKNRGITDSRLLLHHLYNLTEKEKLEAIENIIDRWGL